MKLAPKSIIAGLLAAGAAAVVASSASAAIVCNQEGDCWHVKKEYAYQPGWNVVVHPNNWRWTAKDHYKWREHEGRGYWRSGVWIKF